jgi:hypothetical protein
VKKCKVCGRELPLCNFHRHPIAGDGRHTTCKECRNQKQREYWRKKNGSLQEGSQFLPRKG